jgi:L-glutamine-phosphate cytidylyltransferase
MKLLRSPLPREAGSPSHAMTVARNLSTRYLAIAVEAGLGVLILPFNVAHLGQAGYGLWALTASITAYFSVLDLGYSGALVKFVAQYRARKDERALNEILSTLFFVFVACAAAMYTASLILALHIESVFRLAPSQVHTARIVLLVISVNVVANTAFSVFGGVINGFQRYDLNNLVGTASTVITSLVNVLVLMFGFGLVELVVAMTTVRVLTLFVYRANAYRVFPALTIRAALFRRSRLREVTSFSAHMAVIDWSNRLNYSIDALVIGAFMNTSAVAVWAVAQRLAELAQRLANQLNDILFPTVVENDTVARLDRLQRIFLSGTRLSLAAAFPLAVGLALLARPLVTAWVGPSFEGSIVILRLLGAVVIVRVQGRRSAQARRGSQRIDGGVQRRAEYRAHQAVRADRRGNRHAAPRRPRFRIGRLPSRVPPIGAADRARVRPCRMARSVAHRGDGHLCRLDAPVHTRVAPRHRRAVRRLRACLRRHVRGFRHGTRGAPLLPDQSSRRLADRAPAARVGGVVRAIILAAGRGRRLEPVSGNQPKCLVRIGSCTLLERQIRTVRACGIQRVTVVSGYLADHVERHGTAGVEFVRNTQFATTNSLYSLWLVGDRLEEEACLVLNGDVLFHPQLLSDLLTARYEDALLVAGRGPAECYSDEEMKVHIRRGLVMAIDKTLPDEESDAENIGIAKFSRSGARCLLGHVNRIIGGGTHTDWLPRAFDGFCRERPLYAVDRRGYPWIEIDFPEDYWHACRDVLPAIDADSSPLAVPAARRAGDAAGFGRTFNHV